MDNRKKEQLNIHFPEQVKFVLNVAANLQGMSRSQLAIRLVWSGATKYLRNLGVYGDLPKTYADARGKRWESEEELFGGGKIKPGGEPEPEPEPEAKSDEEFDDPLIDAVSQS